MRGSNPKYNGSETSKIHRSANHKINLIGAREELMHMQRVKIKFQICHRALGISKNAQELQRNLAPDRS